MKKGFFLLDDYEEALENTDIKGYVSALDLLHGECQEFALALNKIFDYKIIIWIDYDQDIDGDALLHAFNAIEVQGEIYYIDIRGITDNIIDIMESFDYWEKPDLYLYEYDEAIKIFQGLNISSTIDGDIYKFIEKNKSNYSINEN